MRDFPQFAFTVASMENDSCPTNFAQSCRVELAPPQVACEKDVHASQDYGEWMIVQRKKKVSERVGRYDIEQKHLSIGSRFNVLEEGEDNRWMFVTQNGSHAGGLNS